VLQPQSPEAANTSLTVDSSPSLAASMLDGLTYLKDYPYLCMEQTVSRFLRNLISLRALSLAGKSSSDLQKNLDDNVLRHSSASTAIRTATAAGACAGSPSQPTTSAYVILGLVEARKSGYTISDSCSGTA